MAGGAVLQPLQQRGDAANDVFGRNLGGDTLLQIVVAVAAGINAAVVERLLYGPVYLIIIEKPERGTGFVFL